MSADVNDQKNDTRLREFVEVAGRYRKSVHLERDSRSDDALAGYIVTPLVRSVLRRLVSGLAKDASQRAWSITGPYGTGKSSLAVFWTNLLAGKQEQRARGARELLAAADPELSDSLYGRDGFMCQEEGFVTVLATGERAGLDLVMLRALLRSLEQFWSGRGGKPGILRDIAAALRKAERGQSISARHTVELIETAARKISESANAGSGLVIVLDEAGKCLEYASHEPAHGDVQLLQELAEAANRSNSYPILFITILHQAIERYAGRLGAAQRNEWAKVQGRFEDIAFQEDADQLLRLVAAALSPKQSLPQQLKSEYRKLVKLVAEVASAGDKNRAKSLTAELNELFPLHPATALILGSLFRTRLAQNERSLFSFLCSGEPRGFQMHLDCLLAPAVADNLYTVDALYDYVVTALGTQLYGHDGRVWAEIDTALRRIPREADAIAARALKTIGLLSLVGEQTGVRPSHELLGLCLENSRQNRQDVSKCIEQLTEGSAIVYRKYRDAYQIWEGSDLDLDGLVRTAFEQTDNRAHLAHRLTALVPPRPIVARRHLFRTGTLRYFEVRYVMADAVEDEMSVLPEPEADGVLLLVLPRAAGDLAIVRKQVAQPMLWFTHASEDTKPVVIGVPGNANHLAALAAELTALEWVQSNTPDLAKDPVAQRELSARISEMAQLIREELTRLMDQGERNGCKWFYRGEQLPAISISELGSELSTICDSVYNRCPIVLNELINRRQLSSAAAAARRNLLEAMVERSAEENLGFEGYPPEISIYRSVLDRHRLHRKIKNEWRITAPSKKGEDSITATWKAIEDFLASTENQRKTVTDLYVLLRKPPYGIKDGLLPIFICAALLYFDSDVAVYERGAFVPGLTTPVVERLLRWPEKFELQRFKIAGVRAKVFERLGRALLSGPDADRPTLLAIVRSLVRFIAELPDYAQVTKHVSQTAQRIRTVLRQAKEPGPLLFRELPEACECSPFSTRKSANTAVVEQFFATLRHALGELQAAYPNLLAEIEHSLAAAFEIPPARANLRDELSRRARRILDIAAEPALKALLIRAADSSLGHEDWLLSVATYLATKPPPKWSDGDFERMQVMLSRLVRKFRALEALAVQIDDGKSPHSLVRLAITQPGAPEVERVVAIREEEVAEVRTLREQLLAALEPKATSLSKDALLAALAGVAEVLLREYEPEQPNKQERVIHA